MKFSLHIVDFYKIVTLNILKYRFIKIVIFFILTLLFSIGCSHKKSNHSSYYYYRLIKKDSAFIKSTHDNFYVSRNNKVRVFSDTTYIFRENFLNGNNLNIINWKTKEVEAINFEENGPNGLAKLNGSVFFPLKKDSIFFANVFGQLYILKNEKIIFKKRVTYNNMNPRFGETNRSESILYKDLILMNTGAEYDITNNKIYNRNIIYSYNFNTLETKPLNIKFPPFLKENCWIRESLKTSMTMNDKNELIVSFANVDSLYIYNFEKNKIIKKVKINSKNIPPIKPFYGCDYTNREKYRYYNTHTSHFFKIKYDENKKVYYLFALLPSNKKKPKPGVYKDIPFLIIVLDKNFKTLAERKFKAGKYLIIDSFVTKEGLWISNNNPLNPNFDENNLSFSLFKLEKNG